MNNQTQQRQPPQNSGDEAKGTSVAALQPPRLPYHPVYKERYGVDGMTWRALVDGIFPSAKTTEGIVLAISYCKARNLDIMKRPVNVVPIWSTSLQREVEGVWPSIAEMRITAHRTGEYAGCDETEFGPMVKHHFSGDVGRGQYAKHIEMDLEFPQWARITVYRIVKGTRCAFPGPKVYWLAAFGSQGKSDVPNDKWQEGGQDGAEGAGSYMLEKCAEAAALRKAFPEELGGMNTAEEMEGRKLDIQGGPVIDHDPAAETPPRPTRQAQRQDAEAARKANVGMDREYRQTMQESREPQQPQQPEQRQPEPERDDRGDGQDGDAQPAGGNEANADEQAIKELVTTMTDLINGQGFNAGVDQVLETYKSDLEWLREVAPEKHGEIEQVIAAKRDKLAKRGRK